MNKLYYALVAILIAALLSALIAKMGFKEGVKEGRRIVIAEHSQEWPMEVKWICEEVCPERE